MEIKYSLNHEKAKEPVKATEGSLGYDLYAASVTYTSKYIEYDTGIAFEFPEGWGAEVFPRSSISKIDLTLANCVGLIDTDYTGTVKLRFKSTLANPVAVANVYKVGDRIGQVVFRKYEKVGLEQVSEVKTTESRGSGGFGSTGQKVINGQQKESESENSQEGRES